MSTCYTIDTLGNSVTERTELINMSQKNWLSIIFLLLVADLSLVGISYFQFAIRSPGQFYGSYDNPSQVDNFALVALERPNVSTKALLVG